MQRRTTTLCVRDRAMKAAFTSAAVAFTFNATVVCAGGNAPEYVHWNVPAEYGVDDRTARSYVFTPRPEMVSATTAFTVKLLYFNWLVELG